MPQRLLRRRGFELDCYTSSLQALAVLESRFSDVDLVLQDMNMPELGGLEVLARAKPLPLSARLSCLVPTTALKPW